MTFTDKTTPPKDDAVYDVIIIGAGASGLFAAASLASAAASGEYTAPLRVLVLEKERTPGRKLLASGSGQCNLTHNGSIKDFLSHYGDHGKELRGLLYSKNNLHFMKFIEHLGVPVTERMDGKVFPRSLSARDVLDSLLSAISGAGFQIKYQEKVVDISSSADFDPTGTFSDLISQNHENPLFTIRTAPSHNVYCAKKVFIGVGGCSYPKTGSDGNMTSLFQKLGLSLVPQKPALVPVHVEKYPYGELAGLSFSNVHISLWDGSCFRQKVQGDLLLTHNCFSGPGILHLSRWVSKGDRFALNYMTNAEDLPRPSARHSLIQTLKAQASGNSSQAVTLLKEVTALPHRFLENILKRCGCDPSEKASRIPGRQFEAIAKLLTEDVFTVRDLGGFEQAMVTKGGVDLSEVNLKTMECRKYPGMYILGEALDVDGDTGGYNLQFAYSSAAAAAAAISPS